MMVPGIVNAEQFSGRQDAETRGTDPPAERMGWCTLWRQMSLWAVGIMAVRKLHTGQSE